MRAREVVRKALKPLLRYGLALRRETSVECLFNGDISPGRRTSRGRGVGGGGDCRVCEEEKDVGSKNTLIAAVCSRSVVLAIEVV